MQQLFIFQCNHKFAVKDCETSVYTIQDGTTTSKLIQCKVTLRRFVKDDEWNIESCCVTTDPRHPAGVCMRNQRCRGYNLYLQQGTGNYEDIDESDLSQQSEDPQNSQETNSSQEERALLNPWSRILDKTEQCHEAQFNALINVDQ